MIKNPILRKRLMVTTAIAISSLAGYGRRAYAACLNIGGSNYLCSGSNTTGQTVNAANAQVSTEQGFSVTPSNGNGITITGDGALSYTDSYSSDVFGEDDAGLYIRSHGNDATKYAWRHRN